jgi:hypothetical protein
MEKSAIAVKNALGDVFQRQRLQNYFALRKKGQ